MKLLNPDLEKRHFISNEYNFFITSITCFVCINLVMSMSCVGYGRNILNKWKIGSKGDLNLNTHNWKLTKNAFIWGKINGIEPIGSSNAIHWRFASSAIIIIVFIRLIYYWLYLVLLTVSFQIGFMKNDAYIPFSSFSRFSYIGKGYYSGACRFFLFV